MKREFRHYIDLVFLLSLGFVPLLWFREGYDAVAGFDFAVYLDPVATLRKSFYVWSDLMAGGYDTSHEISSMPYYLLFSLPMLLGSSFYTAEKIVFGTIFALQGISMYYMLGSLYSTRPEKRDIALLGAISYTFSFPVMAHFGRGNMMALLTYGLLPVLIGLLHKGFTEKERVWRNIFYIALLSLPISATKGHPADFVVLICVALLFALFNAVSVKGGSGPQHVLKFTGLSLIACTLVNLWWIVPNIIYLNDFGITAKELKGEGFYNLETLAYYSSGTSFLNIFRNKSLDLWFDAPGDPLLNPGLYQSNLFILLGICLPMFAFTAVKRRQERSGVFFALVGVIAILMAKGSHPPLGKVFEWMYLHVPGVFFFRAPYRVFSSLLTFSMAPLLGLLFGRALWNAKRTYGQNGWASLERLSFQGITNISASVLTILFTTASTLYAWPVFTGSHLKEKGSLREPGVFQNIPAYYREGDSWLKEHGNSARVYLPYQVYDANTSWGYNGPDPAFELLSAPKAVSRPGGTVYLRYQKPIEELNSLVSDWRHGDLEKVLASYGIGHVLLRYDLNPWVMPGQNYNAYMSSLLKESALELEKEGDLQFYRVRDNAKRVYSSEKAFLLIGDERAYPALSLTGHLSAPFLVMAKDMGGEKDFEAVLKKMDGVIFYNANMVDAVCELLKAGRMYGNNENFTTEDGAYDVFTEGYPLSVSINGSPLEKVIENDGLVWKRVGMAVLKKGSNFVAIEKGREALVVPHDAFVRYSSLIERKILQSELEAVFLFNGSAGELSLPLGAYKVSALKPAVFEREVKDALQNSAWEADKKNKKIIISNLDIDLAEFPDLRLDPKLVSTKEDFELAIFLELDDEPFERKMPIAKEKISYDIPLEQLVRERFPLHVKQRLKKIELTAGGSGLEFREIEKSALFGKFETKKKCAGKGQEPFIGTQVFRTASDCDTWGKKGGLHSNSKPLRLDVPKDAYLMVESEGLSKEALRAEVEYGRLSPTKYYVNTDGKGTGLIVLSESYNRGWTLNLNGKEHKPVKVNGAANGFFVDGTGPSGGAVEYSPQKAYDLSKYASVLSLAGLLALAVLNGRKNKGTMGE